MCGCGEKIIPLCCYQENGEYSIDPLSYWDLIKKIDLKKYHKKSSEYCDKCLKSTKVIKHIEYSICTKCKNVIGRDDDDNYILLDNCSFNNKCLKCLQSYVKNNHVSFSDIKNCSKCDTYVNINCKNMAICYSQSMECICMKCFNESNLSCYNCGKLCKDNNTKLPIVWDCQNIVCNECSNIE